MLKQYMLSTARNLKKSGNLHHKDVIKVGGPTLFANIAPYL